MGAASEGEGVALSLGAFGARAPGGRELAVATVAEGVRRGVRWLDLTDGPELELALSIVAEALPSGAPSMGLFVAAGHVARSPTGLPGELRIIEVVEDMSRTGDGAPGRSAEFATRWPLAAPWANSPAGGLPEGLRWLVVRGSLLDAPKLLDLGARAADAGLRVLLTDPFAAGLLSGSGPVGPGFGSARPNTPWDVASLQRAYAPVLRLEFLTAGRKRTLPQAAVAFARALGAVVSLPVRDRGDLDAWLDPVRSSALSDVELARLRGRDEPPPGPRVVSRALRRTPAAPRRAGPTFM